MSVGFEGLAILLGLFWMSWSWYSLLTTGRGHPPEVRGFPLVPRIAKGVIIGPYNYIRDPCSLGFSFFWWGIILGLVPATLPSPRLLVTFLPLPFNFFGEPGLRRRFGKECQGYRHQASLILSFKRRVR